MILLKTIVFSKVLYIQQKISNPNIQRNVYKDYLIFYYFLIF